MGRPLRIEYPGALYHITSRGNERKNIFVDDADRFRFFEILEKGLKLGTHPIFIMNESMSAEPPL